MVVIHRKNFLKKKHYDFGLFGHRHLPLDIAINGTSRYINLGDWLRYDTYAGFDGEKMGAKSVWGAVAEGIWFTQSSQRLTAMFSEIYVQLAKI